MLDLGAWGSISFLMVSSRPSYLNLRANLSPER
jgi:hypothetical protein